MAVVTIQMNSDGTYRLFPPTVIITPNDQGITWSVAGANWDWDTNGVVCDKNPPNNYAAWPSGATDPSLNGSNQYTASANAPNSSGSWIFYKWSFNVKNTSTGQQVSADPDIGNEPQPT